MQNDHEYIKVAVNVDGAPHLLKINKNHNLDDIIYDVCEKHKKENCKLWGLHYTYTVDGKSSKRYITEDNLDDIKDGFVLDLVPSIKYMLKWIFLQTEIGAQSEKFKTLMQFSSDPAFVDEMKNNNYHHLIPKLAIKVSDNDLYCCLKALSLVLYHDVEPHMNQTFVRFLIDCIKSTDTSFSINVLSITLEVLSQIINMKSETYELIKIQLKIDDLTPFFWWKDNPDIQCNALILLNTIVARSGSDKDELIEQLRLRKNRNIIFKHVTENALKNKKICHELCIYQTHLLGVYSDIYAEQILFNDLDMLDVLSEVSDSSRRTTFIDFEEKESRPRKHTISSQSSTDTCLSDACSVEFLDNNVTIRSKSYSSITTFDPIQMNRLTASCIGYYKMHYTKNYNILFLEMKYHPGFYKICEEIMNILCKMLRFGSKPNETCTFFIPLIFGCPESQPFFEELFCRAVWLIAKTRREMRAREKEDHEKVLAVLEKQIQLVLESHPLKYAELTKKVKNVSYKEVYNIWEQGRLQKWNRLLQSNPCVKDLKIKFKPEIQQLIFEQRIRVLHEGEHFPKLPEKRGKQLYWFAYLASSNRKIVYGDSNLETKKFTNKTEIAFSKIKHVVSGKACPHVKDNRVRRSELTSRCFSLLLEDEGSLDFLAHDELTAQYWTDGLNLLLNKPANSVSYHKEMETLLSMELNLHLLELQNIPIPDEAPPIPPLPPEYRPKPQLTPKSPNRKSAGIKQINI